jgi:hypothetical protein
MDDVIRQLGEFLQTLTWFDYMIAAGVGRGIVVGFKSGGFVELIRWVVLMLTLVVLVAFTVTLGAYLQGHTLLSVGVAQKVVIVLLGSITFMVLKLITGFILKFASMDNNWVMKILGVILASLRWLVVMSFMLYTIQALKLPFIGADVLKNSRWGEQLQPIAPSIVDFMTGVIPRATLEVK